MSSTPENGKQSRSGRNVKPAKRLLEEDDTPPEPKKICTDNSSEQDAAVETEKDQDTQDTKKDAEVQTNEQEKESNDKQDAEAQTDTQDPKQDAEAQTDTQDPKQDAEVQTDEQAEGGEGSPEACVKCAGLKEECAALKQEKEKLQERILQLALRVKAAEGAYDRVSDQVNFLQEELDKERSAVEEPVKKNKHSKENGSVQRDEPPLQEILRTCEKDTPYFSNSIWQNLKAVVVDGKDCKKGYAMAIALGIIEEVHDKVHLDVKLRNEVFEDVFKHLRIVRKGVRDNKQSVSDWMRYSNWEESTVEKELFSLCNRVYELDSKIAEKQKLTREVLKEQVMPAIAGLFQKAENWLQETKKPMKGWMRVLYGVEGVWYDYPGTALILRNLKFSSEKVNAHTAIRTIKNVDLLVAPEVRSMFLHDIWRAWCNKGDGFKKSTAPLTFTSFLLKVYDKLYREDTPGAKAMIMTYI
jgi:hypothetical protein